MIKKKKTFIYLLQVNLVDVNMRKTKEYILLSYFNSVIVNVFYFMIYFMILLMNCQTFLPYLELSKLSLRFLD